MVSKNVQITCCDHCGKELNSTINKISHTSSGRVYHGITWDHNLRPNSVNSPQAQTGGLADLCKECFILLLSGYIKSLKKEK